MTSSKTEIFWAYLDKTFSQYCSTLYPENGDTWNIAEEWKTTPL